MRLFDVFKKKDKSKKYAGINSINEKLFSVNYNSDEWQKSDTLSDEYNNLVKDLLKNYPWNNVFASWYQYLFEKCKDKDSISNFANLFWGYICEIDRNCKQWKTIPDPYKFIAYLWFNMGEEDALLDGISNILLSAKIKNFNIENFHPYEDKIILQYFEEFKTRS